MSRMVVEYIEAQTNQFGDKNRKKIGLEETFDPKFA